MLHKDLTGSILDSCFKISNTLGIGFIESVYHQSLLVELARKDLKVESKSKLKVEYEGAVLGSFEPDLIVENRVIVEVKAVESLARPHYAQALNYLKITNLDVALVENFGTSKLQYRKLNNRFNESSTCSVRDLLISEK
ncbi:MAG: GxxExxY protein [Pyrinomonadaceae bacterium]|nr:GxxExxY protein [Pyrinomonadaceae bacterium]